MRNLKLLAKIYVLVGLLALVATGIGVMGIEGMSVFNARAKAMENASARALHGETLNGLVYAVVMDSRGIYMSDSPQSVEK